MRVIVGLCAAAAGGACSDNPSTPTGALIVIYQDPNFRGDNRAVLGNEVDLDDLNGCGASGSDWDDCISSIRIPSGCAFPTRNF